VGFGNASLLFTAQEYGFTPIGLDLRQGNVDALRAMGIAAFCADLNHLTLSQPCNVISMADVLEHIPYPQTALAATARLLPTGGVLLVSMPNTENAVWQTMDSQNANPYWGEMEHYHNFSRTRLYALLQSHGFEPVRYGISERYRVCMEVVAVKR
jgi:2-polyprenyl-3-methyl-5-hydroxy-6-metoxy-1,4-benzoquinol methylase